MHNLVHLANRHATLGQAIRGGPDRKRPGVFPAIEPLFGCGADQLSGADQRRCRVEALRNAIFARVETRPERPFERDRIFESANPEYVHEFGDRLTRVSTFGTPPWPSAHGASLRPFGSSPIFRGRPARLERVVPLQPAPRSPTPNLNR